MKDTELIIDLAEVLCDKFVKKVEPGRARSVETYAECKALLAIIKTWKEEGFDCAIEQKRKEKKL